MIESSMVVALASVLMSAFEKLRKRRNKDVEVFISAIHQEAKIVEELSRNLVELGLKVSTYRELRPGSEWSKEISDMISRSDIYIAIVSENYPNSEWIKLETTMISAQVKYNNEKLLIPILFSGSEMPAGLSSLQYVLFSRDNLKPGIERIVSTVYDYIIRLEKQIEKDFAISEVVKISSAKYVDKSLARLKSREKQERSLAHFWQGAGFALLLAGAYLSYMILNQSEQAIILEQGLASIVYISFKSLFVVALIIAGVKYAFDLLKAHMNESLKNSDRIHAISFGEFYLDAYGENANWEEIKEVFQHWNINSESYFTKLDSKNYEPDLLEKAIDLVKAASEKK
ncbi:toll/interleukin-1 receptor domain-containing protein [Deinococcus sp. SM5_A1]|uniref:toll/interleukin-1 receptor domain-containing protein n=1 Tax=Deinococcus sp. SM5_A1 TaxID=3379094 RepID=UPI00385B251A